MDNDKLKDMDLNTLCEELNYYSKIKCSECQKSECSGTIRESYCCQLLLHTCTYLDDKDELKKLIEGCFGDDDSLVCCDCKLRKLHENFESCSVYMMLQAYERLKTWRIN